MASLDRVKVLKSPDLRNNPGSLSDLRKNPGSLPGLKKLWKYSSASAELSCPQDGCILFRLNIRPKTKDRRSSSMIDEETVIILVSVGYFNLQREPIKIFCQYIQ